MKLSKELHVAQKLWLATPLRLATPCGWPLPMWLWLATPCGCGWPPHVVGHLMWLKSCGWTRNHSRSSKVSKDSDCSLVFSKNFSEILPPNGWRPGPGKVGQDGLKVFHLWRHSQKTRTPQAKNFFDSNLLDWPIRLSREQLSSAIGRGARALVRQPKIAVFFGRNRSTNIP